MRRKLRKLERISREENAYNLSTEIYLCVHPFFFIVFIISQQSRYFCRKYLSLRFTFHICVSWKRIRPKIPNQNKIGDNEKQDRKKSDLLLLFLSIFSVRAYVRFTAYSGCIYLSHAPKGIECKTKKSHTIFAWLHLFPQK